MAFFNAKTLHKQFFISKGVSEELKLRETRSKIIHNIMFKSNQVGVLIVTNMWPYD